MEISSINIYMTTPQYILNILFTVFMAISVIATVISGIDYLKNGKDLLLQDK